jgi:hypothetical protein
MCDDMIELYSRGGDAYISCIRPLWAVAALELWLEAATEVNTTVDRVRSLTETGMFLER